MKDRTEKGIVIVVSGFSGAGKGTLIKKLVNEYDDYMLSVSVTTRKPREGEEHGVHYFFITMEEYEELVRKEGLLENAIYCDNGYGTPKAFVEEKLLEGKNVLLEIETQGALQIKEKYPDALLLYVLPPDIGELERRLTGRGTESSDVVKKRLLRAWEESAELEKYDYIVINDDVDRAASRIHDIIAAVKSETRRNMDMVERMRAELREFAERM